MVCEMCGGVKAASSTASARREKFDFCALLKILLLLVLFVVRNVLDESVSEKDVCVVDMLGSDWL